MSHVSTQLCTLFDFYRKKILFVRSNTLLRALGMNIHQLASTEMFPSSTLTVE
jgi:hypothetical protein